MRLIKPKAITVLSFAKVFEANTGKQAYQKLGEENILASILPFRISMMPDFQIDLARIKDHWIVISNQEIKSDQSQVVYLKGRYYSVLASEDNYTLDPRTGYFKALVKLGVDVAYGLGQ